MRAIGTWLLITALAIGPLSGTATAQPLTPRTALERLLAADRVLAQWFAPSFLAQVAAAQVEQVVAELKRAHGAYQRVEGDGPVEYVGVFERAVVPVQIALDAEGRISGLRFSQARARISRVDHAVEAFRALPGRVSLLILEEGREHAALNPDTPLAVGSAFKLAVLAALAEQIGSGRRSWRDVVDLRPEWKSLPSGMIQNWPDGSALTVHTLASLMISISDNTATDVLIHTLGREAVEALAPTRNRPFLTTREAWILKAPGNQDLLTRYRTGNESARRDVLREVQSRPLPGDDLSSALASGPVAIDVVEWFFTARELCAIIARVAELPLMGINPGLANRRDWTRVAFKGGSEPGVLNLTTLVESRNRKLCVVATWNNDARLEDARLRSLYSGVLDLLK